MSPIDLAALNPAPTATAYVLVPGQGIPGLTPPPDPALVAALNATLPALLDEAAQRNSAWSDWGIFFTILGVLAFFALICSGLALVYTTYVAEIQALQYHFDRLHRRLDADIERCAGQTAAVPERENAGSTPTSEAQYEPVKVPENPPVDAARESPKEAKKEVRFKEESDSSDGSDGSGGSESSEDENDPLLGKAQ
ncbi:hypothetical protein A1Q2_03584 [Trichosporon asahii var. asahii CBS 8904]|uniref:Transmembrane protein n=1 Tax=Trichosporon asahii var. asahii (strain CBS 8904) TaxID=1220162 RepID=K1VRW1_TRIAC|nr:hypothetical protein A1Q2_03584 [Trichosporon asahii var. asahii CBS 8904]